MLEHELTNSLHYPDGCADAFSPLHSASRCRIHVSFTQLRNLVVATALLVLPLVIHHRVLSIFGTLNSAPIISWNQGGRY